MALATINGVAVTGGHLTMPLEGAATAELTVAGRDTLAFATSASILEVGGVPLTGVATARVDEGGQVAVNWTAGAGGLDTRVDFKHYNPPVSRRLVATDALGLGSEVLSPLSSAAVLDVQLKQWARLRGTVREALRALIRPSGASWRVLPTGDVWIGDETWLPSTSAAPIESEEPARQSFTVSLDSLTIFPGVVFAEQRIRQVEYTLDGTKLRARLSYAEASPLRQMVREETAGGDYTAPYTAVVKGQNADETLELACEDPRLGGMSKVPIRPGLPGLTSALVAPGMTAVVEFENGDPARAVVTGWYAGSAQQLVFDAATLIKLGRLATAFAARADMVDANFQALVATLATGSNGAGAVAFATPFVPQQVAATKVQVE